MGWSYVDAQEVVSGEDAERLAVFDDHDGARGGLAGSWVQGFGFHDDQTMDGRSEEGESGRGDFWSVRTTVNDTLVPVPGSLEISQRPPILARRAVMFVRPLPVASRPGTSDAA